jgi:hypothetical protein
MNLPTAVNAEDQPPELVAATLAELRQFMDDATCHGFDTVRGLALNLTAFFLERNWIEYESLAVDEVMRRMPTLSRQKAIAAVREARSAWVDTYYCD